MVVTFFNSSVGLETYNTRTEAVRRMKTLNTGTIMNSEPYWEYKKTYEAIILYTILRASQKYPEYVTRKKVGVIFTIAMLMWYKQTDTTYTGEKPIYCGHVKRYGNEIGFPAFDKYYDNVGKDIQKRTNSEGYCVMWTEIPENTLRNLVDSNQMVRIIKRAVDTAQYQKNARRTIKKMYNGTKDRFKMREEHDY